MTSELRYSSVWVRKTVNGKTSVEQAQGYTFKIIVTAIVGGLVGAVWMGIKIAVGK